MDVILSIVVDKSVMFDFLLKVYFFPLGETNKASPKHACIHVCVSRRRSIHEYHFPFQIDDISISSHSQTLMSTHFSSCGFSRWHRVMWRDVSLYTFVQLLDATLWHQWVVQNELYHQVGFHIIKPLFGISHCLTVDFHFCCLPWLSFRFHRFLNIRGEISFYLASSCNRLRPYIRSNLDIRITVIMCVFIEIHLDMFCITARDCLSHSFWAHFINIES